ncbi:MAG: hypothetical protein IPL96_03655 [Holophagaceae bacterium]|nr:hypothetical protein [Holophagaceae bacterium]
MTESPAALQAQARITRVIAAALWLAVWLYVFIFATQILKGDLRGFLAPIQDAPWGNPILPGLCGLSVLLPVPAFVMRGVLMARAANAHDPVLRCGLERVAMIVTMALFESVAVYGLVLGFVLGPAAAPVSGLMFLVPLVLNPFLLPPHARFGGGNGDGPLRPS